MYKEKLKELLDNQEWAQAKALILDHREEIEDTVEVILEIMSQPKEELSFPFNMEWIKYSSSSSSKYLCLMNR